jgi:hypothetical protein
MKYLASTLLVFASCFVLAQSYYPLITPCKQTQFLTSCACPSWYEGFTQFYFDGDTTIGLHTYKKLMYHIHTSFLNEVGISELLREDTVEQKIYRFFGNKRDSIIGVNYQTDQLMFDYNYQVGDSVYTPITNSWAQNWTIITAIDTLTLSNQHRVRTFLGPGTRFTEEILLFSRFIVNVGPYDHSVWLGCAQGLNGVGLFPPNCTGSFYVGFVEQNLDFLTIYPNPTSGLVAVSSPVAGDFELFNVLGKLVLKSAISDGEQRTVSVSKLPAGMYVWIFKTESGVEKGKLLIEK